MICDSVTVKCRVKWVRDSESMEELVLSILKERDSVSVGDTIEIAGIALKAGSLPAFCLMNFPTAS